MFSAIRRRLHLSPATVIAGLALVFAMTGGAYAAKKYLITSTKQISPGVLKQLQGKAGSGGAPGVAGAQGAQGPAGPAGPGGSGGPGGAKGETGPAGAKGATGAAGAAGAKGATGATGATGFTETLPSGKTETGTWNILAIAPAEAHPLALGSLAFPIPLASVGTGETSFVFSSTQTKNEEFGSSGCQGIVNGVPTAPKGQLCVYTLGSEHRKGLTGILIAHDPASPANGFGRSGSVLAGLSFEGEPTEPAEAVLMGVWAVTAP